MSFFPMIEYYAELAKLQNPRAQVPKTALNFWYQQQVWSDHKITIIQYFTGRTTEFTGSYTHNYDLLQRKGTGQKSAKRDAWRCMQSFPHKHDVFFSSTDMWHNMGSIAPKRSSLKIQCPVYLWGFITYEWLIAYMINLSLQTVWYQMTWSFHPKAYG